MNSIEHLSHRIHVCYIHLHLVDFYGKCRQIYRVWQWILWVLLFVVGDHCSFPIKGTIESNKHQPPAFFWNKKAGTGHQTFQGI